MKVILSLDAKVNTKFVQKNVLANAKSLHIGKHHCVEMFNSEKVTPEGALHVN